MIYCDSSFLVALYLTHDSFHEQARQIAVKFSKAIPYSLPIELEVLNTLERMLQGKNLTPSEYAGAVGQIERDLADGILISIQVDQTEHYRKARELSKRHSSLQACRTLDILQVAAALLLKADTLCSFDKRQRYLAQASGLRLIPKNLV